MTVQLSGNAEAYVQELLREGSYESAEEVVDLLILKRRADDRFDTEFPPLAPEHLEEELLKGVRCTHAPWQPGEFRKIAERLISDNQGE
jgi:hypothetical protein